MNNWSNILITSGDPEINKIDQFEAKLGKLSDKVDKIRELITRFEVCHFKYQEHLEKIKDSIKSLEPAVIPVRIGKNHIQHGENAWKNDKTGKSLNGQQYVWAIKDWLDEIPGKEFPDKYNEILGRYIHKWLGEKTADKVRLVRLLLARLTWDWKNYEELQRGGKFKELEFQLCRMDICHYAFPTNLEKLLKGIGKMRPIKNFEGCGSFNENIREFIKKELKAFNNQFRLLNNGETSDHRNQIKIWLTACLMKTLKEQVELSEPLIDLSNFGSLNQ